MPVQGTKIVADNIIAYGGGFLRNVDKVMKSVEKLLDDETKKNISLPYSLQQLADLDHPYAKRHGAQGSGAVKPYYGVNIQSGKLFAAEESGTVKASFSGTQLSAAAFVKIDEAQAPHALHVIFGTSKMIPRPVLVASRDNVVPVAYTLIKEKLRNFTVNFKPL